jgi:predicted transcriptional regulator YheO
MSAVLNRYIPIADAVALLLAPQAEVVVHNLDTQQIHYIANAFSKRRPGDPSLTEAGPELDLSDDVIGPYPKTNVDGRRLKSITTVLRDDAGRSVGLLCINLDVEAFSKLADHIQALIAIPVHEPKPALLFDGDWREHVNGLVARFLNQRRATLSGLTSADRDDLLAALHAEGIFEIRNVTPYVADVLGLSRATIYNRLGAIRRSRAADLPASLSL